MYDKKKQHFGVTGPSVRFPPSNEVKSQGGAASFAPAGDLSSPPGELLRFWGGAASGVWGRICLSFKNGVTERKLHYLVLP